MSSDPRQVLSGRRRASVLRAAHRAAPPPLLALELRGGVDTAVSRDWAAGYEAGAADERAACADQLDGARARLAAATGRIDRVLDALAHAAADLGSRHALAVDELGRSLVDAALEIAAAVLGGEITSGRAAPVVLERALSLLPASAPAEVLLHPDDLAALDPAERSGVELVPDPTIERGGCVVRFDDGSIDAQLGPALERVRRALLDDSEEAW